ncbi:hypothetical protein CISIN_1g026712mg [Citrus sinensis]|uniref:CBS domain-containing protein n=1 Tax=Citrus sinensis TaxID=2711 RepID=A0A067F8I0_CITSI|nr:hypothetical protein CISIN_1g026712mg [Citrus sinensis]
MSSISIPSCLTLARLNANGVINSVPHLQLPITVATPSHLSKRLRFFTVSREVKAFAHNGVGITNSVPPRNGTYTVGDFMTKKEDLHAVKTTTTVDEALERLVEKRITGFPVIDDDWKLVGVVSDYDLLALDSISGSMRKLGFNLYFGFNSGNAYFARWLLKFVGGINCGFLLTVEGAMTANIISSFLT